MTSNTDFKLGDAIRFYLPTRRGRFYDKPGWEALKTRLKKSSFTPFEFCHFMIHEVNDFGTANLTKMNMMTSPKIWERFLVYKEHRTQDVRTMVRRQNEAAECYKRNDVPLMEILAARFTSLNDITRIELALFWREELEPDELDSVLQESAIPAMVLAIGSPEFLLFAPLFRKYAEDQEDPAWSTLQKIITRATKITKMPGKSSAE